jgi:hypothetical protein
MFLHNAVQKTQATSPFAGYIPKFLGKGYMLFCVFAFIAGALG